MLPFELTKDTPYLALSGELWSVFYEYFNRNWWCYKGFLLYMQYNALSDHIITALDCISVTLYSHFQGHTHRNATFDPFTNID